MAFVIDQPNCSCCHRCELECPVQAIRMKNGKYWINPELCVSCGHCAAHCHNHAISDPEHPEPAPVPHEKIVKACDVLIIGGGGSGLTAAAKALDMGKSVIVLEKNWETGGSAYFGHMMRVHYSKWHKEAGLPDPRKELYETFVKKTEGRVNNELLRRCLDANVDLANWLIDLGEMQKGFKMGPGRFGRGLDLVDNFTCELNKLRSDPSIGPGASGWFICNLLTDRIRDQGGEIICNAPAVKLLTEGDAVIGALARDPGGEIEVYARSVIMAAGTYSRNKEIMDKMQPMFYQDIENNPVHIYACAACTGDGITMCEEIGADIDYVNKRSCMFGPIHHPYSYSVLMLHRFADPSAALVNKYGQYIEQPKVFEMTEIGLLADKPGRIAWSIIDQRCLEEALACAEKSSDADNKMALAHWERDLAGELRDGSVVKADTLEELAGKLGFHPAGFTEVIREHNQKIMQPVDDMPPFPMDESDPIAAMMREMPKAHPLETGPYYAVIMGVFQENAIGGMTIDENAAVLKNGSPIPGLFAAGDNTRGIMLPGDIGVAYIENVLSAMTYAMCSGYLAGMEAVKHADEAETKIPAGCVSSRC